MLEIVVCVSGGGTNLQAILDGIKKGTITGTKIRAVISNNKNAYALQRARENGIEEICISPKDFPDRQEFYNRFCQIMRQLKPDLIVLAGFLVTIPREMVTDFRGRIINIHPSLIPSFCGVGYYGLKVHEAALARGVKVSGATVHFVDEGTDTGPIILQKAVEVGAAVTPKKLQKKIMEEAEWVILPQAINEIANGKIIIGKGQEE